WNAYGGTPTVERLRWNAYGGTPTVERLRWNAYGGTPSQERLWRLFRRICNPPPPVTYFGFAIRFKERRKNKKIPHKMVK
ncbi:MAG: hypothetical protein UEL26_01785, partial [Segatella copri]|nr:hypothetical protein [Segatella copri]